MDRQSRQLRYYHRKREKEGRVFLEKEAKRKRETYIPTEDLEKGDAEKRRIKVKLAMQKSRKRARDRKNQNSSEIECPTTPKRTTRSTSVHDGPCIRSSSHLVVKLPFTENTVCSGQVSHKFKSRRRISHATSKLRRANKKLESEMTHLKKKLKTTQKQNQRLKDKVITHGLQTDTPRELCTPKKRAANILQDAGILPKQVPSLHKELVALHTIAKELQVTEQIDTDVSISNAVSGNYAKKTRSVCRISKILKMNVKKLRHSKTKRLQKVKKRRQEEANQQKRKSVMKFLERDDISSVLPGKKDGTGSQQLRVLNDFVYNLRDKYLDEGNPYVSLSFFQTTVRLSKHIRHVSFKKREICLCQQHQNFELKLRALKRHIPSINSSAEKFVSEKQLKGIDVKKLPPNITFEEWQQVTYQSEENQKYKRTAIVNVSKPRDDFVSYFYKDMSAFRDHTIRAKTQYTEVRRLKENLYPGHAVAVMDFAENFVCDYLEEVQSSYYNKPTISLHPAVIYYKDETDGSLKVKSYIYCSDNTDHKVAAIFTIMKKLMDDLNADLPCINAVHYTSDSPTSQYRNKTVFQIMSHHEKLWGKQATWTYMEAGHGKGACDGVGGCSKRMASIAVKRGIRIQSAEDFVKWGNGEKMAPKYRLYTAKEIFKSRKQLDELSTETVCGTMQFHACIPIQGTRSVALRNVSCFCSGCYKPSGLAQQPPCPGWVVHNFPECNSFNICENSVPLTSANEKCIDGQSIADRQNSDDQQLTQTSAALPGMSASSKAPSHDRPAARCEDLEPISIGTFVVATYDESHYIGEITSVQDPGSVTINFMQCTSDKLHRFKWPNRKDEIPVPKDDIVCTIDAPVPYSKRVFSADLPTGLKLG